MRRQFALIAMGILLVANAHAGAVVVAKGSPLPAMDADHVKKIFLGRELSSSGQPLTVLYQGVGPERTRFETTILGKTGADLTAYWSKLIFTGRATSPVQASKTIPAKSLTGEEIPAIDYISDVAWSKLVFTGKVTPPIEAGGDDSMKTLLLRIPGSIGYVSDAAIDDSVKVLLRY